MIRNKTSRYFKYIYGIIQSYTPRMYSPTKCNANQPKDKGNSLYIFQNRNLIYTFIIIYVYIYISEMLQF